MGLKVMTRCQGRLKPVPDPAGRQVQLVAGAILPADTQKRLRFIDALRGLAALYVLVLHIVFVPQPSLPMPAGAAPFIRNGGTGVTLFFVISAFTLCYTLRDRRRGRQVTLKFYLRRVFRIVPLYYALLAVYVMLRHAWQRPTALLSWLTFTFNFIPGWHEGLVGASWTLGVEMVFYLLFPAVFAVINTTRKAFALVLGSLLVAWVHACCVHAWLAPSPANGTYLQSSFFHQLPVFALGILAYFLYDRWVRSGAARPWQGLGCIVAGAAGFLLLALVGSSRLACPMIYPMAVTYLLVLLGLAIVPVRMVVNRITTFYGTISYSVYLIHPLIVYQFLPVYSFIYSFRGARSLQLLACIGITLLPLTILASLSYYVIERPGIHIGGWLIRYLGERAASGKDFAGAALPVNRLDVTARSA